MKTKRTVSDSLLCSPAISWAVLAFSGCLLSGCRDKNPVVEKTVGLDFAAPAHFLSHNVEADYPTGEAIPYSGTITKYAGASLSVQSHPDYPAAQLRVIQLPKSIQSTEETARILAESGAVQDCDIMLSFRPEWAPFNGYCNVQLGISHTALATIDSSLGKKYVQTVESPLSYSSRMNYAHNYADLDFIHIIRPHLTDAQKKNVKEWALKTLATDSSKITFFSDYGTPYQSRKLGGPATGILPLDLAKTIMYPNSPIVSVYCSELVWALMALRDVDPSELKKEFPPGSGKDPSDWLKGKINPIFQPLPGMSEQPLVSPGLIQGPDVQMRSIFGSDDAGRRKFLLDNVLITKVTNPAETEGHLSTGHAMAANVFRAAKLPQVRDYYGSKNEASAYIPTINKNINPNYSPTSFFIMSNLPKETRKFSYVATVSFRPRAPETASPAPTPPQ